MWDSCQDIWAEKFESKVGQLSHDYMIFTGQLESYAHYYRRYELWAGLQVNLKVMRTILEDKNSKQDFKVFKTLAARDSSSLNIISSVHTSNLSDFSSESETEIWVSATASYRLGWDVPSAYEKS